MPRRIMDEDEVEYEIGISADEKLYLVKVSSEAPLTRNEFAACLISLGKDMLAGKLEKDLMELN